MPAESRLGLLPDQRYCRVHFKAELHGRGFASGHACLAHFQMYAMYMARRHSFFECQKGGLKAA